MPQAYLDPLTPVMQEKLAAEHMVDREHRRIWQTIPRPHHFAAFAASCGTTGLIAATIYQDSDYLRLGAAGVVATVAALLGKEFLYNAFDSRYRQASIRAIRANRVYKQTMETMPHA